MIDQKITTLITGSTGFIGSALTQHLKTSGVPYHTIDRNFKIKDQKNQLIGSVQDGSFNRVYDRVIHLASYLTSKDTPKDTKNLIQSNLGYGSEILSYSIMKENGLFIDTGSFAELHTSNRQQINYLYSETKKSFELIANYFCSTRSVNYTKIIPYTVYSKHNQRTKVLDLIFESFKKGSDLALSNCDQVLDFIHVDDLVSLFQLVMDHKNYGDLNKKTFECGTGQGTSIMQIISILEEISDKKSQIIFSKTNQRPFDINYAVANTSLATTIVGWRPKADLHQVLKDRWNDY